MKNRSGEKIKLASIDELLGVVNEESAMEIEISKIHEYSNISTSYWQQHFMCFGRLP